MQQLWDPSASASAVNWDGSVIAGGQGGSAVRWSSSGEVNFLGEFPSGFGGTAPRGISSDGSVVVGTGDVSPGGLHPFRWTIAGGLQDLGTLPGGDNAWAVAVSRDGSAIVGFGNSAADHHDRAWRWTAATGMNSLGLARGAAGARAWGVNGDGTTIVGDLLPINGPAHGFLWNTTIGMVDIQTYFASLGIDLTGWVLSDAYGVSADGLTITGHGVHAGVPEPWIATIPAPGACYANCDASTVAPTLNVADVLCFLNRFAAGDAYANCDGSTAPPTLNILDFTCFLDRFGTGCP
jgi:probable HAF family extracellular repeat protein